MICEKCGRETNNNSRLCNLCAAGASAHYHDDQRSQPARESTHINQPMTASELVASPQHHAPTPFPTPAPVHEHEREYAPKPRQEKVTYYDSYDSNRKENVFAILGLCLAFFQPILGIIFSSIGISKEKNYGNGKGVAISGLVLSLVFTVLLILIIIDLFLTNSIVLKFLARFK